ncbi:MAG: cell division protein ZapA [Clostridiales bacterium]|nr:cell division protein ZapA [Clostridiales bacterium]
MESNKVKVKIYEQEYVISGEKTPEHIMKVAAYVDAKMREIQKALKSGTISTLAVLSAVNVADEYFSMLDRVLEIKEGKEKLEKDVEHYMQMWEDAKRSFLQYKEDVQAAASKQETLTHALNEKEQEVADLKTMLREAETLGKKEVETDMQNLQNRIKEIEGSYFDLQMENVQLKSEIDRFKKVMV